jgi:hypothetical protein
MSLTKLYQTRTGGELSPEDCKNINNFLSRVDIGDIPKEQIENVTDYLVAALNMNSVQQEHVEALETLLRELQHG